MTRQELYEELVRRKDRCKRALEDPHVSDVIKGRVLIPEYQIYLLALKGFAASTQENEKLDLLSMVPAKIAAPPTD